jgi:two-component system, cell cycle response regulator
VTARILVIDDVPLNLKLLEARLMAEYFQVLTAETGSQALQICESGHCDLVLLDVTTPEMDEFEFCRRLKANPDTRHLPLIMLTAPDQHEYRLRGLQAGADDFLTKPVNDLALISRVRSLVRLKMVTDELRMRAAAAGEPMYNRLLADPISLSCGEGRILVVDDRSSSHQQMVKFLSMAHLDTESSDPKDVLISVNQREFDCVLISLSTGSPDSLRLCAQIRSLENSCSLPVIVIADHDQDENVMRALELGANDYLRRPVEKTELLARIRTQIRRKRYDDRLRKCVRAMIEMAMIEPLTGLYNSRYFDRHYFGLFDKAVHSGRPLSAIICEIDHFHQINDKFGNDAGDAVLREIARRIRKSIRNIDTASHVGGEEFVIVLPDTDMRAASAVAEQIREEITSRPIVLDKRELQLNMTICVGVAACEPAQGDSPENLLKCAAAALNNAKQSGRNRIFTDAA